MATAYREYVCYVERGYDHTGAYVAGQVTRRTERYDDADTTIAPRTMGQESVAVTDEVAIAAAPDGPLIAQIAALTAERDAATARALAAEQRVAELEAQPGQAA